MNCDLRALTLSRPHARNVSSILNKNKVQKCTSVVLFFFFCYVGIKDPKSTLHVVAIPDRRCASLPHRFL